MSNSAEQLLYLAGQLLETEGDVEGAESALRDAIALSEVSNRPVELLHAKTFLGELLFHSGRTDEAIELFEEVLAYGRNVAADSEEIAPALQAAREYVKRAQPGE